MFRIFPRLFLILGMLTVSIFSNAATRLEMELRIDGSHNPPGDHIRLSVQVFPQDEKPLVIVRPYILTAVGKSEPVHATEKARAEAVDEEGNVLIRYAVPPSQKPTRRELDVVIPYADMAIPVGTHEIYYEVTISHEENGKYVVDHVEPTLAATVTVDNGERTLMMKAGERPQQMVFPMKRKAYTSRNGKLVEIEVEVMEPQPTAPPKAPTKVNVRIPGSFKRTGGRVRTLTATSAFEPKPLRLVRFATNRLDENPKSREIERFGSKISEKLTYGSAMVNIPLYNRARGSLNTASWRNQDPKQVFKIEGLTTLSRENFLIPLMEEDVLVFVHGYNNTMRDAVYRAAQIQHDVEFGGRMVAFSWPSGGKGVAYFKDEKMAAQSENAFVDLIRSLAFGSDGKTKREGRIHVIAHSMGSRVVVGGLNLLAIDKDHPAVDPGVLGNVIFAAPDVDMNRFGSLIDNVLKIAGSVTYYYSENDKPLLASEELHKMNRIGLYPFFKPPMTTICANNANSPFISFDMGHTYFAEGDRLLLDLNLALLRGLGPDDRHPPLSKRHELKEFPGFAHYAFPPQGF